MFESHMRNLTMHESTKKEIHDFFRWGIPRTRNSKIIQTSDWFQVVAPDFLSPAFNEVLFSNLNSTTFEDTVLKTIEQYKSIGTDFKWCVTPYSKPESSKAILEKHGFRHWTSVMMCLEIKTHLETALPSCVRIEKVDPTKLNSFIAIFMEAWQLPKQDSALYADQLHFDHEQTDYHFDRYIAYVDNQPAGVASLMRNHSYGYLHATAVLPQFRGRGAYKALVNTRLKYLREVRASYAISGARQKTSAPILEKLGFKKLWDIDMFLKEFKRT